MPLSRIYSTVNNPEPSYLVVSNLDLNAKELKSEHCAVLGAGDKLFSSGDTLYIGRTVYNNKTETEIYKFALNGKPRFLGSGSVPGRALNQFSMDEYQGHLRIATTIDGNNWWGGGWWGRIMPMPTPDIGDDLMESEPFNPNDNGFSNSVYVLDGKLDIVGKVENIAPGEEIKSVRFVGATGYVITFWEVDPLFVLDLSNAKKPKVLGELKIPGFSSYLHPVADGWLMGIGYPGNDSGTTQGVKLSLFDVRDPRNPKEADVIEFNGRYNHRSTDIYYESLALRDHKAFFVYPEQGLFGLPIERTVYDYRHYSRGSYEKALHTYRIKNGKFVPAQVFKGDKSVDPDNSKNYDVFGDLGDRASYVNDIVYTCFSGVVYSYDLHTAKRLAKLNLAAQSMPGVKPPSVPTPTVEYTDQSNTAPPVSITTITEPTVTASEPTITEPSANEPTTDTSAQPTTVPPETTAEEPSTRFWDRFRPAATVEDKPVTTTDS